MKFYDKISKSGMFADKRVEHMVLKRLVELESLNEPSSKILLDKGVYATDLNYFGGTLRLDVGLYKDGIVRLQLFAHQIYGGEVEVGRLLVQEQNYFNTIRFLTKKEGGVL